MNSKACEILDGLVKQTDGKVLLSKDELKNLLGVSRTFVDNMMTNGLSYIKLGKSKSSKVMFHLTAVANYLEQNQINSEVK